MKNLSNLFSTLLKLVRLPLALLCLAAPVGAHSERITYCEGQIEPRSGENFSFAQYACWLPEKPTETKGVLCVVLHPHGDTGVRFDNAQPWIDLAGRYQCALLSLSFVDAPDKAKNWSHALGGSGRALIATLDEVAAACGVPELAKSRIVIGGICEAGQFAYDFSAYAPERTAAFFTMGGSLHQVPLAGRAAAIPGLLVAASDRGHSAFDNMFALFAEGRRYFAPWEFSIERIKDYDRGQSSALVEGFLCVAIARLQGSSIGLTSAGSDAVTCMSAGTLVRVAELGARFVETAPGCLNSDATNWFYSWEAAMTGCLVDLSPPSSALSFVSVPLPAFGHAGAVRVDLGTINLATDARKQAVAEFPVYSDAGPAVDSVAVASDLASLSWQSIRISTDEWQLKCNFDLSSLPSGTFTAPVPIRFLAGGKVQTGGITILVGGRIVRDVSPEPTAINFGRVDASNQHTRLRLKSTSGAPIKVLGIQSSLPNEVKAEIKAMSDGSEEVSCSVEPSDGLRQTFSGYYLLRVRSDCEQSLKVLFFGENEIARIKQTAARGGGRSTP